MSCTVVVPGAVFEAPHAADGAFVSYVGAPPSVLPVAGAPLDELPHERVSAPAAGTAQARSEVAHRESLRTHMVDLMSANCRTRRRPGLPGPRGQTRPAGLPPSRPCSV